RCRASQTREQEQKEEYHKLELSLEKEKEIILNAAKFKELNFKDFVDKFIEKVLENTEILYKTDGNCLYDNGTILWNINPYENPKLEIVPGQYNNLLRIYVHRNNFYDEEEMKQILMAKCPSVETIKEQLEILRDKEFRGG
ncbi:16070_t:CDS:2, partial [Funneliformis geosporum]